MRMRALLTALGIAAVAALAATGAEAQDFGVMESAETIQPGNFKLVGYPLLVLGDDGVDDELGFAVRGGYGFSDRFDAEVGAAFYEDVTFLGVNGEVLLVRAAPGTAGANLAARVGVNFLRSDLDDSVGLDLAALVSTSLTPRLELVGALDYGRRFLDDPVEDVNTLHLVPGVEFGVTDQLDFLAEFGVALNDEASHYLSAGLAFYLR